jgi:flagellar assembly protein FliH
VAKNVFRSQEVRILNESVSIPAPELFVPVLEEEDVPEVEEYTGPSADDLRREAELFRNNWEQEKQQMIDGAKAEAVQIVEDAEKKAFEEVQKKSEQAQKIRQESEDEAKKIVSDAEKKAEEIIAEAEQRARVIEQEAQERGFIQGTENGFLEGKTEAQRVIDRIHVILNKTIERRQIILEESETQIVHLVLEIAKKVVKVISENQRNVVINNVVQALNKLKTKTDVTIRVNIADLKITTEHVRDIIEMVEKAGNITVAEDSSVDPGGCIIETDFGEIDARISSQLREIENRILELTPIRSGPKRE